MSYKSGGVSKENLMEYIKADPVSQKMNYFEKSEDLEESIKRLEDIYSITLENGLYHVTETIIN